MDEKKHLEAEKARFRPKTEETSQIRATRFLDLCKSCGACIVKCPVNAISWDPDELGQLGEPAILIDMNKCIGCEMCERICPDGAIQITNKRLESKFFSTGLLGKIVGLNAVIFEHALLVFRPRASRLKQIGKTKKKTLWCWVLRTLLRYRS